MEQRSLKNKKRSNYCKKIRNGKIKKLEKENEIIREIYEEFFTLRKSTFIKIIRIKKKSIGSSIKRVRGSKLIKNLIIGNLE